VAAVSVTIGVLDKNAIAELPSFNPGELLARVKGVDFIRSGVVGTGVNIRGFNSNFNAKNLQVTDGRFSTLIATGLPFGPLNTVVKEDIERVEVILGPNAALYGPNAHNGLVNTITKDPRTSEGLTLVAGGGSQSTLSARGRWAHVINDKFAYKVTAEYTRGEEFDFVDSVYISRDGLPGNEVAVEEFGLDNTFSFVRGEAAMYYTPKPGNDIILSYGGSNSNYLAPTNVGRNMIRDWQVHYAQLRFTNDHWFAQVYHTWSLTDSTYSLDERTKQYYRLIDAGVAPSVAAGADSYASGALFADRSRRWNGEVQYNNTWGGLNLVVGLQAQRDLANSLGTYLLDENEDDYITVNQAGLYGQLDYNFGNGFKALGAFRFDNHQNYGFNFVPKLGVVYTNGGHSARFTYGKGIAAPTILNLHGNLFGGLILGNAEGFTLADGTEVDRQRVENLQTFEAGYIGNFGKMINVDVNGYYNISSDFLSPLTIIGVASQRGSTPVDAELQQLFAVYNGLVATYVNFGQFNTYGADFGITFQPVRSLNVRLNYSYFGYNIDENDTENNDFNNDGTVNILDILVNAPNNKASLGINYNNGRLFGTVFTRWVEAYDYFSSFQIAAATNDDLIYRGVPVVADARSADTWNYGPLGGFVNVDVGLGYKVTKNLSVSAQVTNLFNAEVREFTASPFIGRLIGGEIKFELPR
ncbi:MAG: TonB-dependent receptor, partial [Bacteroidota bacterium]